MANATTLSSRPFAGLKLHLSAFAMTPDTIGTGIGAAMLFGIIFGAAQGFATGPASAKAPLPAPPSMAVRAIAPEHALMVNQEIPLTGGANPAAHPFLMKASAETRAQALECLASAVYYEAGNQSAEGGEAVAQVVLNRVRHPAFPGSVCGVVYQGSERVTGCQFSFTCDGSLYRQPEAAGWRRAKAVAEAALAGKVYAQVGLATHYHADYVVPYWASTLAKNAVVGAHIFYHWNGGWGRPSAFVQGYSGREASAAGLRSAALAVEAATAGQTSLGRAETAIAELPGVETIKLAPSMRGDKRVALRFNQTARKAADEAAHKDYGETFKASDNLRWTLSGESANAAEAPLGKASPTAAQGDSAAASLQR